MRGKPQPPAEPGIQNQKATAESFPCQAGAGAKSAWGGKVWLSRSGGEEKMSQKGIDRPSDLSPAGAGPGLSGSEAALKGEVGSLARALFRGAVSGRRGKAVRSGSPKTEAAPGLRLRNF